MIAILIGLLFRGCQGSIETNESYILTKICDSYRQFENDFQCGPNGYFKSMAIKYCRRSFDPS